MTTTTTMENSAIKALRRATWTSRHRRYRFAASTALASSSIGEPAELPPSAPFRLYFHGGVGNLDRLYPGPD